MKSSHSAVIAQLSALSIRSLVELWETTEANMKLAPEIPKVRGWIMDALEIKHRDAFDSWIDDPQFRSPRYWFIDAPQNSNGENSPDKITTA